MIDTWYLLRFVSYAWGLGHLLGLVKRGLLARRVATPCRLQIVLMRARLGGVLGVAIGCYTRSWDSWREY